MIVVLRWPPARLVARLQPADAFRTAQDDKSSCRAVQFELSRTRSNKGAAFATPLDSVPTRIWSEARTASLARDDEAGCDARAHARRPPLASICACAAENARHGVVALMTGVFTHRLALVERHLTLPGLVGEGSRSSTVDCIQDLAIVPARKALGYLARRRAVHGALARVHVVVVSTTSALPSIPAHAITAPLRNVAALPASSLPGERRNHARVAIRSPQ